MSTPIGDPRPASTEGDAGDKRKAGETGPAGDPRPAGQPTVDQPDTAAPKVAKPKTKVS